MSKVVRIVAGVILIVGGIAVGYFGHAWGLGKDMIAVGITLITWPGGQPNLGSEQNRILNPPTSTDTALPVIYGIARVGGILVDARVDAASTDRKRLVVVVAWCHGARDGGDIAGIDEIWIDDRPAIIGSTVQDPFNKTVPDQGSTKYLEYTHHLGSATQTVDATLSSLFGGGSTPAWPSTSRGRGVAYSVFRLWFDADIYPGGFPGFQAKIRGARVEDPRDSFAWSFGTNPALCIRDYLLSPVYGFDIAAGNLEEQSFIDMANYCDELVSVPGVGGTVARYTLNGWVATDRPIDENLAQLCTACRGLVVNEGSIWRLVIRRQRVATTFVIDETNTVEGTWSFVLPGAEVPNILRVTYVDAAQNDGTDSVQWPPAGGSNAYVDDDAGLESRAEINLPYTNHRARAQQLAMTMLREARQAIGATVVLKEMALTCRIGDIVAVTHPTPGWNLKPFDVLALLLQPDATVQAVLGEYEPTVYDLSTVDTPPTFPDTDLPNPFTCAPPTDLVLLSGDAESILGADGVRLPRIKATWTAAVEPYLDHYEIQAKKTADTVWDSWGAPLRTDTLFFIGPVTSVSWDVRLRAVNRVGVASIWISSTIVPSVTISVIGSAFGVHVGQRIGGYVLATYAAQSPIVAAKIAFSDSSQPAAGTGTLFASTHAAILNGPYEAGATIYVTFTAYFDTGGTLIGPAIYQILTIDAQSNAGAGKEDIVLNGDFEDGRQYWGATLASDSPDVPPYTVRPWILATATPFKGTYSAELTAPTGGIVDGSMILFQSADPLGDDGNVLLCRVHPGDVYRIHAALKASTGSGVAEVRLDLYDDAKEPVIGGIVPLSSGATFIPTTSWAEYEGTAPIPDGTYYVAVSVKWSAGEDETLLVDELHLWRMKNTADLVDFSVTAEKLAADVLSGAGAKVTLDADQDCGSEQVLTWDATPLYDSDPALFDDGHPTRLNVLTEDRVRRVILVAQIATTDSENQNLWAKIRRDGSTRVGFNNRSVDDEGNGAFGGPSLQVVAMDVVAPGASAYYEVLAKMGGEGDHMVVTGDDTWFAIDVR